MVAPFLRSFVLGEDGFELTIGLKGGPTKWGESFRLSAPIREAT